MVSASHSLVFNWPTILIICFILLCLTSKWTNFLFSLTNVFGRSRGRNSSFFFFFFEQKLFFLHFLFLEHKLFFLQISLILLAVVFDAGSSLTGRFIRT